MHSNMFQQVHQFILVEAEPVTSERIEPEPEFVITEALQKDAPPVENSFSTKGEPTKDTEEAVVPF